MFSTFSIPISWTELIKRTIRETSADNVLGLAAQLAYYFLLALVPAIVFLVALTSFFPPRSSQQMRIAAARGAGRHRSASCASRSRRAAAARGRRAAHASALLMALWSSSAAMVAVTDALNRAYDIEEGRPWWKVRLTAIALTVGAGGVHRGGVRRSC